MVCSLPGREEEGSKKIPSTPITTPPNGPCGPLCCELDSSSNLAGYMPSSCLLSPTCPPLPSFVFSFFNSAFRSVTAVFCLSLRLLPSLKTVICRTEILVPARDRRCPSFLGRFRTWNQKHPAEFPNPDEGLQFSDVLLLKSF
ncbi:hypothetical protein Nepgr_016121 [Nepenthes gracilis]|uniref:Uncharacterized protein n=1 Tax=Nepenthes gracilis TaxID=150966 RepID=A0AAD3XS83_NEPGR|nr:hypothetical protein Nepgr_016121 [Nepenthes gracilis]